MRFTLMKKQKLSMVRYWMKLYTWKLSQKGYQALNNDETISR